MDRPVIRGAADARVRDRYMPIAEVIRTISAARSTIYDWMQRGLFPKPYKLGPRRVAWLEREVNEWMLSREATL
jgi:prophage regulatory protein